MYDQKMRVRNPATEFMRTQFNGKTAVSKTARSGFKSQEFVPLYGRYGITAVRRIVAPQARIRLPLLTPIYALLLKVQEMCLSSTKYEFDSRRAYQFLQKFVVAEQVNAKHSLVSAVVRFHRRIDGEGAGICKNVQARTGICRVQILTYKFSINGKVVKR